MNTHQNSSSPNDYLIGNDTHSDRQSCNYFVGSTDRITLGNGNKGIVVFSNPKASSVNIVMNYICSSNLSGEPVSLDIYYATRVSGNLNLSSQIIQGNKACQTSAPAKSKIYYGNGDVADGNRHILTQTLPAYKTCQDNLTSAVVLPPGTNHVYIFSTINNEATATICMCFTWWEEDVIRPSNSRN
ncbi:MAG: DUF6143 family protein [bacterium]|nr:DUF6143 family protein [bacterium]